MSTMIATMTHNPWLYISLMGALSLLTVGLLFAVRMLARDEERRGNRRHVAPTAELSARHAIEGPPR